ncbi:2Fe-2S iron-sulfur cluster-binding protein [Thalassomonas actiniarum]|uniref:2Fe-2S iron-sulfur cluster binding domain-containing protein n=1 Tax=Thalassomonas actiniarum TaxID=485447 RepID=A0AAF0C3F8_9GAMM|nr:2Fe-2S iron-sulfur cluster-binding protein [Thalassomonas actiniarum]WDD98649.1 2Fe-2S iron-sulfur cluster binding domain-containing protein [Thalassomonas actiniarum]
MQYLKALHKWTSVIVGIQLLLWLISGFYFVVMDHQGARGSAYRVRPPVQEIDHQRLVEPALILSQQQGSVALQQISLLGTPYYLLTHEQGLYRHFKNVYSLVNAYTGELAGINKQLASALARSSYNGPGTIISAARLEPPIADLPKEKNTVWQVNFDDDINTSVYLDAGSGHVIGHSNDDKRFADFFFMLHFMDYGSVKGFNNIQIIFFAVVTLFLSLTGFIWTINLIANGRYALPFVGGKKVIELIDNNDLSIGERSFSPRQTLLDGLIEHDIALPSSCGGGGTCGRCKILTDPAVVAGAADKHYFTDRELALGYRLACQHKGAEISRLKLLDAVNAGKHQLTLVSSEFISPAIKELRFTLSDGSRLEYRAGAYMRFFIPAARGCSVPLRLPEAFQPHWHHIEQLEYQHLACSRSYSLANYGGQQELVFTIKYQSAPNNRVLPGVGSSYLCNLEVGQNIEAAGPFEDFYAENADEEYQGKTRVMIGAGAGMAPLKALIYEQLEKFNSKQPLYFYFGARSEQDLIYYREFSDLAQRYGHFHYLPTLSQASDRWQGARGYVQEGVKAKLASLHNLENVEFYLCGPANMMSDTIAMLTASGVKPANIAFDDFSR